MSEPTNTALFHDALLPLLVDVKDVRPHPANPRNGDIDAIAESIQVNGCYRPLYAQRSSGFILAGNHTYHALLALGADAVPVIWLDVDEISAKRILAVDNHAADLGNYDNGVLLDLLDDLAAHDSLLGTAYTEDDRADLRALVHAEHQPIDVGPEQRGWPMLHFRVPPQARTAFYGITDAYHSDTERFLALLRRSGWNG
jgi:ParB-like chromosome segregation protein Spo0J